MNRRTDFERNWNALPEGKVHRPTDRQAVGLMKSCPFDRHTHGLPDAPTGSHRRRRHKATDTVKVYRAIILGIIPVLVLCYGWAALVEQLLRGIGFYGTVEKGIGHHRLRREGQKSNLIHRGGTYPDDDLISTSGQDGRRFHTENDGLSGGLGLIGELRPRNEPWRGGGTSASSPRPDDWRRIGGVPGAASVEGVATLPYPVKKNGKERECEMDEGELD
uniref:Uncharacterized protein n=1 Tax=Anopheles merus TaxID=30066 RepID=A0A182VFY6_ANOME